MERSRQHWSKELIANVLGEKMNYQLVIQFPETLPGGLDELIKIEDELVMEVTNADVDGHDIGSGEMNIFILTENPLDTFEQTKNVLMKKNQLMSHASIAYRRLDEEDYICLWPEGIINFQVV